MSSGRPPAAEKRFTSEVPKETREDYGPIGVLVLASASVAARATMSRLAA